VKVEAAIIVPGRISEAEAVWFDTNRWPTWLDGFGHLARVDDTWPATGARVDWDSRPQGRGRVSEKVIRYEPRVEQVLEVEDGKIRGTQRVAFEGSGTEQTRVTLSLDYELKERTPFTPLLDKLFVRRAMRDSLKRSLWRFANERKADVEFS
jgi:hypothetical protein